MEVDIHSHTIASGHAYSTINEMAHEAGKRGIKVLATTDHGPAMPGGPHIYHFHNLRALPAFIGGVRILKGAEVNIVDYKGEVDIHRELLDELEFCVASFHFPCLEPKGVKETTRALISCMENDNIHAIGHPEDIRYPFEIKEIVSLSKESKTPLEINNSSLLPTTFREGTREGIIKILEECGRQNAPVVFGSDSHHTSLVGVFDKCIDIAKEVGFPNSLILNKNSSNFLEYIGLTK